MSTNRTINGKSFKEVQEALKAPFSTVTKSLSGFDALTIEMVEERLDEVLGLNYSFVLTKAPELTNLPSDTGDSLFFLMGVGEIQVFDDDGNLVARQAQGGGARVIYIDKTGSPKDPTDNLQAAITDIKKKCAKNGLGVGRYLSLDPKSNSASPKDKNQRSNNRSQNQSNNHSINYIQLKVLSNATTFRDRIVYRVSTPDNKKYDAVIWDKVIRKLDDDTSEKVKTFVPGSSFWAEIEEKLFEGEKQLRVNSLKVG